MLRILLVSVWCFLVMPVYADMSIFQPQHRLPEDMVTVLKQQFPSAAISHYGHRIVVNAPPAQLSQIQALIQRLDTPIQKLRLTVRMKEKRYKRITQGQVEGTYCQEGVCVSNSRQPQLTSGVNVQVNEQRRLSNRRANQQVTALDGRPAYISIGQSIPIKSSHIRPHYSLYGGLNHRVVTTQAYRDADQGFYVVPRVVGSKVYLDVRLSNDRVRRSSFRHDNPTIDTQRVVASVEGRLNEWLPLGLQNHREQSQGSGFINAGASVLQQLANYEIRVESFE